LESLLGSGEVGVLMTTLSITGRPSEEFGSLRFRVGTALVTWIFEQQHRGTPVMVEGTGGRRHSQAALLAMSGQAFAMGAVM
jgi:hypothetical protein